MNFYNFNIFLKGLYNCLIGTQIYITNFGSISNNIEKFDLRENSLICYISNMIHNDKKQKYFSNAFPYVNSLCLKLDLYIEPER